MMRKGKRNYKLRPYLIGVLFGYIATVVTILPAALILSLMKSAAGAAGAAAVVALMIGSFVCGRISGTIHHKDGLKTGFLCGLIFSVPIILISVIFSSVSAGTLFLKAALCTSFAAVGGVSGVNSSN